MSFAKYMQYRHLAILLGYHFIRVFHFQTTREVQCQVITKAVKLRSRDDGPPDFMNILTTVILTSTG